MKLSSRVVDIKQEVLKQANIPVALQVLSLGAITLDDDDLIVCHLENVVGPVSMCMFVTVGADRNQKVHVATALAGSAKVGNKKAVTALGACIADSDDLVSSCASEVLAEAMLKCSQDVAEIAIPGLLDHLGEQPFALLTKPSQFVMRLMMAMASQNVRLVVGGGDDCCAPFVARLRITSLSGIAGGSMQTDERRLCETQSQTFLAALASAIANDSSTVSAITPSETSEIMLKILRNMVVDHEDQFTPVLLSIVCYAIGFLDSTMSEREENKMIVEFGRFMLDACAVRPNSYSMRVTLSSGFFYVLTQHRRFLRNHSKFLITVIKKLHDFMLWDAMSEFDMVTPCSMAVYYFNKIAVTCIRELAGQKEGESFIEDLFVSFQDSVRNLDANSRELYI
jgi:hypothetical protein